MPPQSRGTSVKDRKLSTPLLPFTESSITDFPSPNAYLSDQQTPTGPVPIPQAQDHGRSTNFEDRRHDRNPSSYQADIESIGYNDELDFQSHYTASVNSPPSSPSTASDFDNLESPLQLDNADLGRTVSPAQSDDEDNENENSENENDADDDTFPLAPFPSRASHLSVSSASPPTRPLTSHPSFSSLHSTTSHPGVFAPPFYNRPPTPLPPSPSLTSLLRPAFSANTSRPTTPDSSDVETPNDTEAAVAQSARRAKTVPRASPNVPTFEYYGFGVYLGSSLAFLLYILWSYLPSPFLHQLGLSYYPDRWWSLAIPAFIVILILYIYVALLFYNIEYLTKPLGSVECIVDEAANVAVLDGKGRIRRGGSAAWARNGFVGKKGAANGGLPMGLNWKNVWSEGTDAVMDIPIGGVCEVLYGEGRDDDELKWEN